MRTVIEAAGRTVELFSQGGGQDAPILLLCAGEEGGEAVFSEARALTDAPFRLAVFPVARWEEELSPWPAPRVFRGGGDFGSGADETVRRLTGEVLPRLRAEPGAADAPCYLAGYSLAGLFALYDLYRTDAFRGAASCSGSLWFPGFSEFAAENDLMGSAERIYLSLGDRESRTKNPVMATVEDRTKAIAALLRDRGVETAFELNPGNHFRDPEKRLARGVAWICERR